MNAEGLPIMMIVAINVARRTVIINDIIKK